MAIQNAVSNQFLTTTSTPAFVNVINGFTSTATAAGTTVLTATSTGIQEFTGSTTQTVTMPVVSTLPRTGVQYYIVNNSSGVVTVNSSGGNAIQVMAADTSLLLTCILNTGTTAASWNGTYFADSGLAGAVLLAPSGLQTITNFDLIVNTVRIGLGANNIATNTALGSSALSSASLSGTQSTGVGANALTLVTSATNNTAIGYNALSALTIGSNNTAVGRRALVSLVDGTQNNVIGVNCMSSIQNGSNNIAMGHNCLSSATVSSQNTSLGSLSAIATVGGQVALTTGTGNTNIGYASGFSANDAAGCIALGAAATGIKASGATSSDIGPGISIGSSGFPVGVRGDGTIYPSTTGAGFWRPVLNGTPYMIPLITDGASAWPAITTSSITFSSTSGIIGTTTNDSAATGSVGQFLSSVVDAVSGAGITTGTAANVTSISLTAGDWDVWGLAGFNPSAGTIVADATGWVSSTSATQPDASLYTGFPTPGAGSALAAYLSFPVPQLRFSLSGTTTIYLSVQAAFSVSTLTAFGAIYARRRR